MDRKIITQLRPNRERKFDLFSLDPGPLDWRRVYFEFATDFAPAILVFTL